MGGRLSYETLAGACLVQGVFVGAAALWSLSARPPVARAHVSGWHLRGQTGCMEGLASADEVVGFFEHSLNYVDKLWQLCLVPFAVARDS